MQSVDQYRRLGRSLLLEYGSNQEKLAVHSSSTQDSGTSSLLDAPRLLGDDIEKKPASNEEVQSARVASNCLQHSSPDSKVGLSPRDLALASSVGGVTVRDCSAAEKIDEKVFVVEAGRNDGAFNPRNWTKSYRIWATFVLSTLTSLTRSCCSVASSWQFHGNQAISNAASSGFLYTCTARLSA